MAKQSLDRLPLDLKQEARIICVGYRNRKLLGTGAYDFDFQVGLTGKGRWKGSRQESFYEAAEREIIEEIGIASGLLINLARYS